MPKAAKKETLSVKNSEKKDEQWLVRMPGGPLRLVKSNYALSESQVKSIYLSQLKFNRALSLENPDLKWPFLKVTTDDEVKNKHSWLTQESRRKNHRGIIDVVDGKVVPDKKVVPEQTKVNTKIETKIG